MLGIGLLWSGITEPNYKSTVQCDEDKGNGGGPNKCWSGRGGHCGGIYLNTLEFI